jgi:type II secretory pathway pseudopilin PulG
MRSFKERFSKNDLGFSYIDVMIAIVILLIGVLALASALTANLIRSYETDKVIISKQIALSTIESIISARNIKRPGVLDGWKSIGNVGTNIENGVPKGIFVNGWAPIREEAGWDGIAGTVDDACPADNPCTIPGRPTNNSEIKTGFERRVVITDVQDSERPTPPNPITRRRIDVTVKYYIQGISRQQTVSTLLTNY